MYVAGVCEGVFECACVGVGLQDIAYIQFLLSPAPQRQSTLMGRVSVLILRQLVAKRTRRLHIPVNCS